VRRGNNANREKLGQDEMRGGERVVRLMTAVRCLGSRREEKSRQRANQQRLVTRSLPDSGDLPS